MDFKKIKKLVSLVETSDISSLSVEEDNLKVEIKRELSIPQFPATSIQPAPPIVSATPITEPTKTEDPNKGLIEIKSPMVGTFYSASNPESSPFVVAGNTVKQGDIVCIVEAMKLFNEIESDVSGTIEKVCVENGASVEFGQALFLVRQN